MRTIPVNVIIPVYNRSAYLPKAVASVTAQSMPDFELIIVDDGSTDDSLSVANSLARSDPRITVLSNRGHHGPGGARNAGLVQARGDWVAFLDSDDQWRRDALAQLIAATAPGLVLVGGNHSMLGRPPGRQQTMTEFLFGTMVPWWESHPLASQIIDCARLRSDIQSLSDPRQIRAMTLGNFLWVCTSSVIVRRSAVIDAGLFDAGLKRTEDMDLWLRLLHRGGFAYVDSVLARCEMGGHEGGDDARYEAYAPDRRHDSYIEARYHLAFIRSLPRRFALDETSRAFWRDRMAALHRMCGFHALQKRYPHAVWHYAAALAGSRHQRHGLSVTGREFFQRPW